MTKLFDLFPEVDFAYNRELGNITIRQHKDFENLLIANYTDQVAFARDWNPVTKVCRGLIWDDNTFEVLARPFPKFFNFDEPEAPRILDDQVVWHYANKFDGSLGIVYRVNGHLLMATRGSFHSEQAALGTKLLSEMSGFELDNLHKWIDWGYTPLFEICGPDNRIVLRYDENFLARLGYIKIDEGTFVPPNTDFWGRRTMRELLGDLSRENSEGWVVWLSHDKPLKIKQADYIELHRMVSNLTKKEVWRQLRAGTYNDYAQHLPDELFDLAEGWANDLRFTFTLKYAEASQRHQQLIYKSFISRKDQAMWVQNFVQPEVRGLVFSLLDGKDISDSIWRLIEPSGGTS